MWNLPDFENKLKFENIQNWKSSNLKTVESLELFRVEIFSSFKTV
jgi:hypothetical protein